MNLKAMLLTGLFILLKYTVSSSQRLVLSNCGYLTLTFFACQEVFFYFHGIYRILVIFLMNIAGIAEKIDKILTKNEEYIKNFK